MSLTSTDVLGGSSFLSESLAVLTHPGNPISSVSLSSLLAGVFSTQLCFEAPTFLDSTQSP